MGTSSTQTLPRLVNGAQITDPPTRESLRVIYDMVYQLQTSHDTLSAAHDTLATKVTAVSTTAGQLNRQVSALKSTAAPTTRNRSGGSPDTPGDNHTPPGAVDTTQALAVITATAAEYPSLVSTFPTDAEALTAADELLRRILWHLQIAGFQAGRQRNPSGLISQDKITLFLGGAWHAYDIFTLGYAGHPTTVHLFEISGANSVPDTGIPD